MSTEGYDLYEREEPALSGVERAIHDAVGSDEPWSLVERFADLERVSGSEDERRAADHVADRLDALGVAYDRHEPELYLSVPGEATLRAGDESFDAVKAVSFGGGVASGPVVPVGGGDADGVDDLLSADLGELPDLEGRIALLGGILPIEAVEELQAAGAAGVIVQHPHEREPHDGIATPVWGGAPTPESRVEPPETPVVTVAEPVGERLRERAGTPGDDGAATVELAAETTTGWEPCPVIVAEIEGGAAPDDGFVLLHGHYDSWHVGVADNATGDAALLELARVFDAHSDELRRDLRVAWWPGHSTGRYAGSTWYAEAFAGELRRRCVAQVNVDSPGAAGATEFEDMVAWMPEADELCRGAIDAVCGKPATENRPPRAGDYSFDNLGVTGLFMLSSNIPREVRTARGYHAVGGCGGNADAWHLTTDTLDKADPDVLVRDIRVYATAVARLLRARVLPLDHRRTVARHRETVAEYDAASGFDLGPVLDELDALAGAVDELYDAAGEDIPPATANDAIRRLSRALVRVDRTTDGQFEQDPAYDRPPYPGLEPARGLDGLGADDRRRLRVSLRRQRNRAVALLRDARADVERAIEPGGAGVSGRSGGGAAR